MKLPVAESQSVLDTPATDTVPAESIWPCALIVKTGTREADPYVPAITPVLAIDIVPLLYDKPVPFDAAESKTELAAAESKGSPVAPVNKFVPTPLAHALRSIYAPFALTLPSKNLSLFW